MRNSLRLFLVMIIGFSTASASFDQLDIKDARWVENQDIWLSIEYLEQVTRFAVPTTSSLSSLAFELEELEEGVCDAWIDGLVYL